MPTGPGSPSRRTDGSTETVGGRSSGAASGMRGSSPAWARACSAAPALPRRQPEQQLGGAVPGDQPVVGVGAADPAPEGRPVGVQVVRRHAAEETLLGAAALLEEASPWADRRPAVLAR
ncbi:hypothetical protein [Geodermatophilus pulveris]|uniref:hypothetical protein n=1 Tax=Geodermatophilus pulveris TaxID=1564159 RepID=UPI000B76BA82|nr:hypothetical protein [Geodermatophilus pulveris]